MENTFVLIFSSFKEYVQSMFDGIAEHEVAERDYYYFFFFTKLLIFYLFLFDLFLFNDLINKC